MNFQKFASLPLRTAQKHSHLVRQDNAFELLQLEAEKIRRHQVKMEIRLKEKDKEVEASKHTIDSLRKSMLESRVEKEKISNELQEEIKSRSTSFKKLETTRQMCIVLKNEFERLEETLRMCIETSAQLREENKKKKMKFEKLNDDFIALTTGMKELSEIWQREHTKLTETSKKQVDDAIAEKEAAMMKLRTANEEISEKKSFIENLAEKLKLTEIKNSQLMEARISLQHTVTEMLKAISELKHRLDENERVNSDTIQQLQTRLNETSDLAEEQSQIIRDMNEEYATAKQTWQILEEGYQTTIKNGEKEIENLISKCDDLETEKEKCDVTIKDGIELREEMRSKMEELESQMLKITEQKDGLLAEKMRLEVVGKQKDESYFELEETKNNVQALLREKQKLCEDQVEENRQLSENIEKLNKELENKKEQLEDEILSKEKIIGTLKQQMDTMKDESQSLNENIAKLKSELDEMNAGASCEAKKLQQIREECKGLKKTTQQLEKVLKQEEDALKKARQKVEETELNVKEMKEKNQKLVSEVEEKDKKIFEKEAAITKTVSELKQSKENVEKVEKALRQSKIDVNVFCMHLKETEQALNDEAEKLMKRNEELAESKDKVKKLEFELKDKECEIVLLQEQNARFKEKRILQEQCSFNSETFQRRSKHRTQPEPKRIKEEPVAVAPTKWKSIRRTSKVQNILFNDTADDLLSEVSFGSQAENITTVDHRKPTQKSSTPKAVNAPVHKRAQSATRRSGSLRKSKHIKKETENKTNDNWWENDSVYGFKE